MSEIRHVPKRDTSYSDLHFPQNRHAARNKCSKVGQTASNQVNQAQALQIRFPKDRVRESDPRASTEPSALPRLAAKFTCIGVPVNEGQAAIYAT